MKNLHPIVKEMLRIIRHPVQYLLLRGVYSRIRQLWKHLKVSKDNLLDGSAPPA